MSGPDLEFPAKLRFLFEPHRFKVAYGGRGGAKSWAFARALLVLGSMTRLRILCTREVQKSIKDSVKRLLDDQIEAMGMQRMYESLETEIRGVNGTEFFFAGLQQHTVDSIKSFEGADLCWIEEAQTVSERSLNILIPTIRKPDSEIWVSFNPQLDTDPVWKRFIENPPTNARVQKVNWNDNPWFPTVLEAERLHCQETDKDNYGNIWEGECRSSVAGAIYSKEIAEALQAQRICPVPYDPRLKVHTIWDLGFNDSMSIILAQKGVSDLRVIGYLEDSFKTLDWYAAELNKMNYNWGYDWLPHDAKAADFKTGLNTHQILKKLGRRTKEIPNIGIEMGIKAARMLFPRVYFDKVKAARLIECLKRYRRGVPTTTGEPGSPVHDAFSHGADAFRYLAVVSEQLRNEDEAPAPRVETRTYDTATGY